MSSINLKEWKEKHPRITAIVKYSESENGYGEIIAESNSERIMKQEYEKYDPKKYGII